MIVLIRCSLCSKSQKVSEIIAQKIYLAKDEWNFVSWMMVYFKKSSIDVWQRFWIFVIFNPNWEQCPKMWKTFLEKFQQIWNFLVNEKWKNGLPEDIWSKISHFSIQSFCRQYLGDKEKMANFYTNIFGKAVFPLFIYQKVSNMLKFFKKCWKIFWKVL